MLDIALHGLRRRLELGLARLVELEVGRVDDDVGAGELAELADLDRSPGGLDRAPATEDENLLHACGVDRLDRCVGRIGRSELVGRQGEHPRHVERHVPFPTTTARSCERSNSRSWKSGWPLYQATKAVAGHEPARSSPGMPSRRSV